tara:strand:+ start:847 stop:1020 length:174 start_codon:yes stop_codon:yes gene_type:complete
MTKKHFTAIAETLNLSFRNAPSEHRFTLAKLAANLADQFGAVNPNFNRSKFLAVALA